MCTVSDFGGSLDHIGSSYRNTFVTKSIIKDVHETTNYPNNIVVKLRGNQNTEPLFLSTSGPTVLQKIISKFTKDGFWFAYEELIKYLKKSQYNMPFITYPLNFLMMQFSTRARLKGAENLVLPDISKTKLCSLSVLRCLAWNINTHKLAVVSSEDIIFIYNNIGVETRIENRSQRYILSVAWRPLSTGTLAVGCENGIFIWTVQYTSLHVKPVVNIVCKFVRNDHRFVTGLSWNKMGDILISTAVTSKTMYIWNYPLKDCVPMRRINSDKLNFVHWSPDNSKVFECSINETFRIWSTNTWVSENWSVNNKSRVQCACWSVCSSILLFGTDSCSIINAIYFQKSDIFIESKDKNVAWPIIDLNRVSVNDEHLICDAPSEIAWDHNCKRLAITFKNNGALVVFQTILNVASIDCVPLCIIQGYLDAEPSTIAFISHYKGSLLTIGWSNGKIENVPFSYNEKLKHDKNVSEKSSVTHKFIY